MWGPECEMPLAEGTPHARTEGRNTHGVLERSQEASVAGGEAGFLRPWGTFGQGHVFSHVSSSWVECGQWGEAGSRENSQKLFGGRGR